jgi:hypothetical protein
MQNIVECIDIERASCPGDRELNILIVMLDI